MSAITEFSQQADLAFAAYATVTSGMKSDDYIQALENVGMSKSQAKAFAAEWKVVVSQEFTENEGIYGGKTPAGAGGKRLL